MKLRGGGDHRLIAGLCLVYNRSTTNQRQRIAARPGTEEGSRDGLAGCLMRISGQEQE